MHLIFVLKLVIFLVSIYFDIFVLSHARNYMCKLRGAITGFCIRRLYYNKVCRPALDCQFQMQGAC